MQTVYQRMLTIYNLLIFFCRISGIPEYKDLFLYKYEEAVLKHDNGYI